MHLLDLPNEILSSLPLYFNNIETFTNAAATCRRLRDNLNVASPRTILHLAAASAPTFFSPHPHFLVAATARQASDWALGDKTRTSCLREALQDGIEGFFDFIIDNDDLNAGLSLHDIRRLHLSRFSIINPLADKIDKMAGEQWYGSSEDFWDGGVSDPATLETVPSRAAFQIIIYGELFGRSMENSLNYAVRQQKEEQDRDQENLPLLCFDLDTRFDYIKYCIPNWTCRSYPGLTVLPRGPYTPGHEENLPGDQIALEYIVKCRRWRRMWVAAMESIGGPEASIAAGIDTDWFHDEQVWRERLYFNAIHCTGLEAMQLVTLPPGQIPQACRDKALHMKGHVDRLTSMPRMQQVGHRWPVSVMESVPDFGTELYVCMRSYWPGT